MFSSFRRSMIILALIACNLSWLGLGHLQADERAFRGTASGSVVGQIPPNGLEIRATGQATHLGNYTRCEQIFVGADGSISGQISFKAANGDILRANVTGQFVSLTTAVGEYQFVGGTGRFASASGVASFQAVTPDGTLVNVQFAGKISY